MERARARDLVVGAEANRRLSTDSSMVAVPVGGEHRCPSEFASLDEKRRRQWLTLYHLRRSMGEESDLEVLQPWTLSGERREESKYAAGA